MNMSSSDWLMLLALSFLWGGSYFLIEIALTGFPVLLLVAVRVSLAAIALWIFVAFSSAVVPRSPGTWLSFLFMGIINNVLPFSLIVWAQTTVTSSLASILNATTPIFAVIVTGLLLNDEPITRRKSIAVFIGFVGVVVMLGVDAMSELGNNVTAQIALLLAALSYAFASAYGRRFSRQGIKPVVASACQVTMSALLLGGYLLTTGNVEFTTNIPTDAWLAVIALSLFSTALAYILYFNILASAGATNLMLVTFLIPLTAILLGILLLDERLHLAEIIGMLLIGVALIVIDGRAARLLKKH